jgi:predicted esterase
LAWSSIIEEYGPNSGNFVVFTPTITSNKMIVALHGSGERAINFVQNWTKEAEARHYYVVVPNSNDPNGWSGADVNRVLMIVVSARQTFGIKKTLLSGASSGGHVALLLGINEYPLFDATQTFMGLAITEMGKYIQFQSDKKKRRPILLIHGVKDALIPVKYAQMNRDYLKSKNYNVTYWEEPNMIHENYRPDNNKILDWFEKQKNN